MLKPFTRLTRAAVEALRYRGEDVARSLTKSVVKEVRLVQHILSQTMMVCDPSDALPGRGRGALARQVGRPGGAAGAMMD